MPDLLLDGLPADVYEGLKRRAAARRRSPRDEAAALIEESLRRDPPPRLPDQPFLTEEFSPPFDLPRPRRTGRVAGRRGKPRLPDPIDG